MKRLKWQKVDLDAPLGSYDPEDAAGVAGPEETMGSGAHKEKRRPSDREKTRRAIIRTIIKAVLAAATVWAMITFVFGVHHLKGNYMFPALRDGDLIITYRLEALHLNEVVAYEQGGKKRLARIVALPGSVITEDENGIKIDGAYPAEQIFYPTYFADTRTELPYTVPADSYFLLNDFRTDTADSRTFGGIHKDKIEGKVLYIFRRRGF